MRIKGLDYKTGLPGTWRSTLSLQSLSFIASAT